MKGGLEHTASGTDILHCLEGSASGRLGRSRSSRHGSAGGLSTDDHTAPSALYAPRLRHGCGLLPGLVPDLM